jgi:hypothetical protein
MEFKNGVADAAPSLLPAYRYRLHHSHLSRPDLSASKDSARPPATGTDRETRRADLEYPTGHEKGTPRDDAQRNGELGSLRRLSLG